MADLNKVAAYVCKSFRQFQREVRGKTGYYIVRFDEHGHSNDNVQCDWSCTCASYRFQRGVDPRGYCKHITKVMGGRCGWSELHDGGEVVQAESSTPRCPRCSGEVEAMEWGV
jgi:hypothetical protein